LEIKRLFAREHEIHGATQFMREHGQCLCFALGVCKFGKLLFAGLTLAEEEHGGFGKGPA